MEENKKTEEERNKPPEINKEPEAENISSNEPLTTNTKQETNDMEVPHKHHHDLPGKKEKSWKHYTIEFFMIFLAVTAGYFVENQREHFVERKREKQFMTSLVKDLQLDTSQFSRLRMFRLKRVETIDSLIIFFQKHSGGAVPAYGYALANKLFGHAGFFQNSGTLDQLKNSGGLRLIEHRNVVDSIEFYDQQIKRVALRDIYESNFSMDHSKLLQKLFDGRTLLKIFTNSTYYKIPASPSATVKLNEQYLDEYLNNLVIFRTFVRQDMGLQATVKEKATRLITVIKKEYQLE